MTRKRNDLKLIKKHLGVSLNILQNFLQYSRLTGFAQNSSKYNYYLRRFQTKESYEKMINDKKNPYLFNIHNSSLVSRLQKAKYYEKLHAMLRKNYGGTQQGHILARIYAAGSWLVNTLPPSAPAPCKRKSCHVCGMKSPFYFLLVNFLR